MVVAGCQGRMSGFSPRTFPICMGAPLAEFAKADQGVDCGAVRDREGAVCARLSKGAGAISLKARVLRSRMAGKTIPRPMRAKT